MLAEAVLLVSASAVAIMVAVTFVAVTAAVKSPAVIVPAVGGVTDHVTLTLSDPVTVASNWIVPPEPTAVGSGSGDVIEIATGKVIVSKAPVKLHPVAPLEAVQPDPLIVALPALAPVTVLPEIVATPEGDEVKLPPVHPAGADAMLVPPTTIVVGETTTAPEGQLGAGGVMTVLPPPPQAEKNSAAAQNSRDSNTNAGFFIGKFPPPGIAIL